MRGWGIEERGQSDVSAYSRAKERIVTLRDSTQMKPHQAAQLDSAKREPWHAVQLNIATCELEK